MEWIGIEIPFTIPPRAAVIALQRGVNSKVIHVWKFMGGHSL